MILMINMGGNQTSLLRRVFLEEVGHKLIRILSHCTYHFTRIQKLENPSLNVSA